MNNEIQEITLRILEIFPWGAAKMVSLQYPKGIKPRIGGYLYTEKKSQIKLSGYVWDIHPGEDIYDCVLEGEVNELKVGDNLFSKNSN